MKASRRMSMAELVALALLRGVEVRLYDTRTSLAARINAEGQR